MFSTDVAGAKAGLHVVEDQVLCSVKNALAEQSTAAVDLQGELESGARGERTCPQLRDLITPTSRHNVPNGKLPLHYRHSSA